MRFKKVLLFVCQVVCVLLVMPSVSWCEDAENEKSVKLESVTVTANKIKENIQDVPQSITVIDKFVLEEKGIRNVADVINEIPNMSVSSNHGNAVNFRGLNSSTFTSNNPVVIYIDGVPYSDKYGFDASLVNVERIEVLRGPQGTLYGKDAIGGVINIVTMDPENELRGKVGAEYGSFNFMRGLFNCSGPLIKDSLYLGITGQYQQDDGWIENTHAGMDENANKAEDRRISAYLLFKPIDQLRARLTISNDYNKSYWMDGYVLPGGTDIDEFNRDDAEKTDFDVPSYEKVESNSQSLNLSYDFGAVMLSSTTTHRKLELKGDYDADSANNLIYAGLKTFDNTELDTWNQELRLSSNSETGIRWVGGLYLDVEQCDKGPYGMQFPGPGPEPDTFVNYEMNAESKTDSDTYAIFGQLILPLGLDFELTLGGRYQSIEKKIDLDMFYLPVGITGVPMFEFQGEKSWDVFLPKFALSYGISNAWNAYASYSQGYMPGGFNFFAMGGTEEDNSFEPQQSTNYEIGIKGSLDRLRVNASLFYMDIEDIHVYKAIGNMYLTDNAKKAHSQGVELDLTYRLTETIELSGAAGIIQAEYDDYDAGDAGDGISYDGENIENTPSHTFRFGVAYLHPKGFYTRLDIKNQGHIYFYDDFNKDLVKEDAYTMIDAKIGYKFDTYDFYVYGKNLSDEKYINSFMSNSSTATAYFGEPITVGLGVRYQF